MTQYRLHIDIPLANNEEEAIKDAKSIVKMFNPTRNSSSRWNELGVEQVNYRLGHDDDRQKSNYLDKNENGHVSNKKTKIHIPG